MAATANVDRVTVAVYPIAGKQLFFHVPDSVCHECDLTVRTVERVIDDLSSDGEYVKLEIKPWLNNIIQALWRGGWHPPVVVINGKLFSQGVVPQPGPLKAAIRREIMGARGAARDF